MGELRPHHTEFRMEKKREMKKKKDRKWEGEPDDRGGQLQTVVWFWRTEASPILSFLIHAVRWGATIPEGRQEPSAIWEEGKIQKTEKEEKSTGFRSLGTNLKEEKENYCVDFQWKKMCLFDHWVIQNKETVQEIAQTLQWKPSVTEKSPGNQAHTHSDTIIHTHLNMWTQKQQKPKPKK